MLFVTPLILAKPLTLAGISFYGHLGNVTQTKKGNFVSLQR